MRKARPYIIGCFAAAALFGCSSNASTESGSTAAPTDSAPPSVAGDPASTESPTTTIVSAAQQVRADFDSALAVRDQCAADPATCDFAAVAIPSSPMDIEIRNLVAMRLQLNLRTKPGFGDVTTTVEETSVAGDSALLTACSYDTATLFDIGDPANPDDDTVFDDSQYSTRMQWEMSRVDGKWLVVSGTELARAPGGALCQA